MGYIDPNTGGMLFQVLVSVVAALSGLVLIFSRQIRSAFARLKRSLRERGKRAEAEPEEEAH
jgi:hypothetical protein